MQMFEWSRRSKPFVLLAAEIIWQPCWADQAPSRSPPSLQPPSGGHSPLQACNRANLHDLQQLHCSLNSRTSLQDEAAAPRRCRHSPPLPPCACPPPSSHPRHCHSLHSAEQHAGHWAHCAQAGAGAGQGGQRARQGGRVCTPCDCPPGARRLGAGGNRPLGLFARERLGCA